ncbi:MAG: NAD-dependent epimerase/dehydratase family protein [Novosphingobium sp.]|nr:NAD-dependent epimerase/dehydratase family protein [Novosphingobium sp.]
MHNHENETLPADPEKRHVLIAGASGVIGAAALKAFARAGDWRVTALSRRKPIVPPDCAFDHRAADLTKADACADLVSELPPVTHLVYAAVAEAPGLATGWQDDALIEQNGQMLRNLLGPLARRGHMEHVSIMQGGKGYGAHLHPVTIPLRESSPRDEHRNFYWLHEDFTREQAERHGFSFTIWRPQVLLGSAPGAAMNPVAGLGAYAAICRERGLPFVLPGDSVSLWEMVDADLFAEAMVWAATSEAARGETFNFTNGDMFALRHAWHELAEALELGTSGEAPENFTSFFADPQNRAAWAALAAREHLLLQDLDAVLGQSQTYLDILNSGQIAEKAVPMIVSTIKLRQAGFGGCVDSLVSLRRQLSAMVELRLLPTFCDPDRNGSNTQRFD